MPEIVNDLTLDAGGIGHARIELGPFGAGEPVRQEIDRQAIGENLVMPVQPHKNAFSGRNMRVEICDGPGIIGRGKAHEWRGLPPRSTR
ncbi:hypothetical protein GRI32_08745 [Altererythrobacter aestuarii]|uniref:Uncharacterized protein n=1 Tax=Alteraurantiacibacter aestuarii TaxID=650004 RepID=A0A844ZPV4_9SPHN|nr:hypothetical protein [Alteraurantiacibacter aestuarii]MXO88827.1 hypothetical protein [Alteraurantiacibacter aestuarii]